MLVGAGWISELTLAEVNVRIPPENHHTRRVRQNDRGMQADNVTRRARRIVAVFLLTAILPVRPLTVLAEGELANSDPADSGPRLPNQIQAVSTAATFVGSMSCAECHPDQTSAWRNSDHALAMRDATPDTVLGSVTTGALGPETDYELVGRGDLFIVADPPANARCTNATVRFTFGVRPLQQYLASCDAGRLQALPMAWDTRSMEQGGQRWFSIYGEERIRPGDRLHWGGRFQNANSRCIDCHSTAFQKNYRIRDNSYDSRWQELGVGCEACHGPGSEHVAWGEKLKRIAAQTHPPPAGGQEVSPVGPPFTGFVVGGDVRWVRVENAPTAYLVGSRTSDPLIETCARCHSLREPLTGGYSSTEGFFDAYLPAVLGQHFEIDGQDKDEVYTYGAFLQSKMYHSGVTCTDCHDPHASRLRAEGNALCARCHNSDAFDARAHHFHEPGTAGAVCTSCHMPPHVYMVMDVRHDHGFRIPRPDLTVRFGVPNPCTRCHADRSAQWAADAIRGWFPSSRARDDRFVEAMAAARQASPAGEALLLAVASDKVLPAIQRASALAGLGDLHSAGATGVIEEALEDSSPLVRAYAARALGRFPPSTRWRVGQLFLDDPSRAVRLQLAHALAPVFPLLEGEDSRRRLDRVLSEYRSSLLANADQPEASVNLGLIEAYRGNLAAAGAAYQQALKVDERSVLALVNMADLLRLQGRDEEAEPLLRRAVRYAPSEAGPHHALGLLLQRRGQSTAAIDEIARAAELAPEIAAYSYVHAIALQSVGDVDQAMLVLDAAIGRHPNDKSLLLALAIIRLNRGDLMGSRELAERVLSRDPTDSAARAIIDRGRNQ